MDDEGSRLLAREAASGDVDAWMRWRRSLRLDTDLDLEEALTRIVKACLKIHLLKHRDLRVRVFLRDGDKLRGSRGLQARQIRQQVCTRLLERINVRWFHAIKRLQLALGAASRLPPFVGLQHGIKPLHALLVARNQRGALRECERLAISEQLMEFARYWSPKEWPTWSRTDSGMGAFRWEEAPQVIVDRTLAELIEDRAGVTWEEARTEVVDEKPKTLEVAAEDCDYVG